MLEQRITYMEDRFKDVETEIIHMKEVNASLQSKLRAINQGYLDYLLRTPRESNFNSPSGSKERYGARNDTYIKVLIVYSINFDSDCESFIEAGKSKSLNMEGLPRLKLEPISETNVEDEKEKRYAIKFDGV